MRGKESAGGVASVAGVGVASDKPGGASAEWVGPGGGGSGIEPGGSRAAPRGGAGRPGRSGEVAGRGRGAPRSASTAGWATSAGLAERGGSRRSRGDRERLGPRRRAPRLGREPRQSVPPVERGPPPSQRSAVRSVTRGHAGSTRGAAACARRPRVKKKARPRSARSEEVTRSEEGSRSEEAVGSEEVALSEEVARSEEMAAAGLSVTVTHSERGLRKSDGVSGFGHVPSRSVCPCVRLASRSVGSGLCPWGRLLYGSFVQHTFPCGWCFVSGHLLDPRCPCFTSWSWLYVLVCACVVIVGLCAWLFLAMLCMTAVCLDTYVCARV